VKRSHSLVAVTFSYYARPTTAPFLVS